MENLFNVNQVAFILKVHPLTIRRYIKEGKLKAVKAAGNVRIKESDLANFNSKEVTPKPYSPFTKPGLRIKPVKIFSSDDPFFQLRGRGANLNLDILTQGKS